ncbi:MAG: DUF1127 domain-containing protein [Cocleimonas sp.]|nr:DUF1127 domain-containing protein [Cocleimonas sp.]
MSTYIENNHHNNYSQYLPTCEVPQGFSTGQIIKQAKFWASRSHQRKQLALLDEQMLADIGITAEQAKLEIAKPFWK